MRAKARRVSRIASARRHALCVVGTIVLAGCAAFTGVPPSDLSSVHVGVSRTTVEGVLGEPVETVADGCGTLETYEYDQGAKPVDAIYSLAMFHPAAPIVVGLIAHPFVVSGQEAEIDVAYGPDGQVITYRPRKEDDWGRAYRDNQLWYEEDGSEAIAERYYRIGLAHWQEAPVARSCFCRSANLGHAGSQFQLARLHRLASLPNGPDVRSAYLWYAVAERHGAPYAAEEGLRVAALLNTRDRVGAEFEALTWRPDPGACKLSTSDNLLARAH